MVFKRIGGYTKDLSYGDCVTKGKQLVENYRVAKFEICELTLRVCEIQVGGHYKDNVYSMKRFADDIGLNINTLRKWMEEHRNVVQKLGFKPKAKDYKIIREIMKRTNSSNSEKEVRGLYDQFRKYTSDDYALLDAIKRGKQIRNFVKEHALSTMNADDVRTLFTIVDDISIEIKKGF